MSDAPTTCLQIAAAVQSHQITARSACDAALAAADRWQASHHPFIRLLPEMARRQAERVDALVGMGRRLPLAGVPFAVKDVVDVKGVPTTCGSRAFADRLAEQDAVVIRKLMAMGAVLVGKLNMHECAFGFTGENPIYGDCRNPWNAECISGGSSSGSAVAVSLGICPFTIGSDTGGSVRLPAALCGVVGLKPTYGRISRAGLAALAWSLDHVGLLTRSAEDAAVVLRMLAGHDLADSAAARQPVPDFPEEIKKPLGKIRLGIPQNWFAGNVRPDIQQAVDRGADYFVSEGCERVPVTIPLMDELLGVHRTLIFAEAANFHRARLATRPDDYSPDIRRLFLSGLFVSANDFLHAQRLRSAIRETWTKVFKEIDVLVTPTTPMPATRFGETTTELPLGQTSLLRACLDFSLPFNVTGYPAVSLPCGFTADKLPIGLQLVGRPFDEATILRMGYHYQQHTTWHQQNPA